ncbi:MAG: N-acetylglucosamine-6-phosphate deacetylase [Candidatus Binatia bacterium]|nr:MAG: N-acetylglucosamine-6-phosphate deacetylase [Candidatus Binatia bacterium]
MTQDVLFRGASVLVGRSRLDRVDVRVADGLVVEVGAELSAHGAREVRAEGKLLAPAFVDLHVHGAHGAMFEEGEETSVRKILAALPRYGVGGVLATIAALPERELLRAVRAVVRASEGADGAAVLGIHLEGPFLNPLRAGAQSLAALRPPNLQEWERILEAASGRVRMVTVAPELEGATELVEAATRAGIVASVGHSDADEGCVERAVAAGARHVTHLYNAMRGFHHRETGPVGVALTDDRVSVELVCDGHHVSRRAVEIAWRCKPEGKLVLVTDAVAALGMPEGEIRLFGVPCRIADGAVRLASTGQLAGSCLSLDRAVRTLRGWFPALPLARVLWAASGAPCEVLGLRERGEISPGRVADLVLLDEKLEVVATMCRGVFRYGNADVADRMRGS